MTGPEEPEIDEAAEEALEESTPEQLAAAVRQLKAGVEELQGKLADTMARLRTVSKAYTDLQADGDAFRQRTTALIEQKAERKAAEAVEAFFDPVMNLERSLSAAPPGTDAGLISGLRIVQQQFWDAMTRLGLERIPTMGVSFDPLFHEAIAVAPVDDPRLDGKVLVVHRDGWRVKGKAIQPAQVIVGRYEAPKATDDGEDRPAEAPNTETANGEPTNGEPEA